MQRAMARQAEAEREKRAKIIHAEGEFAAAQRLSEAARVIQREPVTLQLRYLQTLTEIGAEKNSTIVFPLPIDVILPFLQLRTLQTMAEIATEKNSTIIFPAQFMTNVQEAIATLQKDAQAK